MAEPLPVVGFIGLGRMGGPMCHNLLRAGFPVLVYNRTPAKAEGLRAAGARVLGSAGDVAEAADVICACLDRVEASREVFLGRDGVVDRSRAGSVAIDHGTIGPDLAREIGADLGAKGIGFLDAPVSGGPEGADQGALTIMVGGSAETFERARPVMRAYGKTVVRMGGVGAGSLTKLVNQLLTLVHGAAAAEALAFAERSGLALAAVGEVMKVSFGQSKMLERTLSRVLAGNFESGAALRLYAKDLDLIDAVARETGAVLPLTGAAGGLLAKAAARGWSDRDVAALIGLFRRS